MNRIDRRWLKYTSALALLTLAVVPLAAQQAATMGHDHSQKSQMSEMEQMMAPMMRAMAFTPEHLLSRKDSLNLTPPQITRLTALRDATKKAHDAAGAESKGQMDAFAHAWNAATPDTVAMKQHLQAVHTGMCEGHWAKLAAAAQAKAVLTDEQRGRVDRWASSMMERHH